MPKAKRTMTAAHKAAIASGRAEGAVVRRYLESLQQKGRPGRRIDPERTRARLAELDKKISASDDQLTRLDLVQTKLDLEAKLADLSAQQDSTALEAEFAEVAKSFAARKGIGYAAFRAVGVPAAVLKRAGIARTRAS